MGDNTTNDLQTASEQKSPAATEAAGVAERAEGLDKRRPTAMLLVGAASGLLFGLEFAAGAVLGIGATYFLGSKTGPEVRDEVRRGARKAYGLSAKWQERLWQRSREMLARAHHRNGEAAKTSELLKQEPRSEGDQPHS
jgi:hypothetical protein